MRVGREIQALGALAAPEDEDDRPVGGERKQLAGRCPLRRLRASGNGPANDAVLGLGEALDRIGKENTPREGRGHPVREAEMGVGLGQRGRNPAQPGGEDHRPGYVAASAEHDIRPAASQDLSSRGNGERRRPERARELRAEAPRETLHAEDVQLETRLADEARVSVGRDDDLRSARPERFGDRECRQDVSCCSACGDQALRRWRRRHG